MHNFVRHLALPIRQDHEQERPGGLLRRLHRLARRPGADLELRGQIVGLRSAYLNRISGSD